MSDQPYRLVIHPREAAALHRLLDMYIANDDPTDPGLEDLAALMRRLERAPMDHSRYAAKETP